MGRFADAAETVPQPCQVFGTRLLPFSLGHHLLFKRLGLPLIEDPDADASVGQLLKAVVICANAYTDTLNLMVAGTWAETAAKWHRDVAKLTNRWINRVNFPEADKSFRDYLREGYRMTPLWGRKDMRRGIDLTAPWEELLLCRLVMAGFSQDEVLNGYLPAMRYHYFTVLELNQAARCQHEKDWKRVFFTRADNERIYGRKK